MRRVLLIALCVFTVQAVAPAVADAHYKAGRKSFQFGGITTNDKRKKADPLNIFFHGWGTNGRVPRHINAHWKPSWVHESDIYEPPFKRQVCKGSQFVRFRRSGTDARYADDYQGVGPRKTSVVPDSCWHRYHTRTWWDDHHNGGSHSRHKAWAISNFHWERVYGLKCGPRFDLPPAECTFRGHYNAMPWDSTEFRVQRKMRKRPASGHKDANSRSAGHCVNWRWRKLPGARGRFGSNRQKKPYFSDGVATKISMLHCPTRTRP